MPTIQYIKGKGLPVPLRVLLLGSIAHETEKYLWVITYDMVEAGCANIVAVWYTTLRSLTPISSTCSATTVNSKTTCAGSHVSYFTTSTAHMLCK